MASNGRFPQMIRDRHSSCKRRFPDGFAAMALDALPAGSRLGAAIQAIGPSMATCLNPWIRWAERLEAAEDAVEAAQQFLALRTCGEENGHWYRLLRVGSGGLEIDGQDVPRDASQQAEVGPSILWGEQQRGDVVFFQNEAGKVVHVVF